MPAKGQIDDAIRDADGNVVPWKKRNREKANAAARDRRQERASKNPLQERLNRRKWFVKHKFGITVERREEMIVSQNFCCAICGLHIPDVNDSRWAIDHDHETDEVREMLCKPCNSAIGLLRESIVVLANAIKYLIKHKK